MNIRTVLKCILAALLFVRGGAIVPTMDIIPSIGTKPLDSLVVKVFPDGESEYVMYDCDAESYGYENGLVAKTLFEFHLDSRPSKVNVNGVKVRDWSWNNGVLILKVTDAQVAEKLQISII